MVTIGNDHVSVGLFHRWTENVRLKIPRRLISPWPHPCIFTHPHPSQTFSFGALTPFSYDWRMQNRQVEDVESFLGEVLDDFVLQGHLQELVALRDQLSDIAAEKANLETDRADVLNVFKPFEPVVEALRAKYALAETISDD